MVGESGVGGGGPLNILWLGMDSRQYQPFSAFGLETEIDARCLTQLIHEYPWSHSHGS